MFIIEVKFSGGIDDLRSDAKILCSKCPKKYAAELYLEVIGRLAVIGFHFIETTVKCGLKRYQ